MRNRHGLQGNGRAGLIALGDLLRVFSSSYFTRRRDPDYFSKSLRHLGEMVATLDTLENAGSYWRLPWHQKRLLSLLARVKAG